MAKLVVTKLGTEPIGLKLSRPVIIDSVNLNEFKWQMDKTIEEMTMLQNSLLQYKKNNITNEQMCESIGNLFVQVAVLTEIFGSANVQIFVERRLQAMKNRHRRLKRKPKSIGFNA